jgi:hypothetical protein
VYSTVYIYVLFGYIYLIFKMSNPKVSHSLDICRPVFSTFTTGQSKFYICGSLLDGSSSSKLSYQQLLAAVPSTGFGSCPVVNSSLQLPCQKPITAALSLDPFSFPVIETSYSFPVSSSQLPCQQLTAALSIALYSCPVSSFLQLSCQ